MARRTAVRIGLLARSRSRPSCGSEAKRGVATRKTRACVVREQRPTRRRYDRPMWPAEALDFLRELEENNDRDWFKANRKRYEESLLGPARQLAEDQLRDLGEPRFFRPFRDTRFRPGPPIKEQLGVAISADRVGAYYFELSLDGLLIGAGLHHPATDQLERFRAAVADERRGAGLERALRTAAEGGLVPIEPALKRAPKGYSPDHPRIDRLRMKQLTVYHRYPLESWLHTRECDARIRASLEAATPFVSWLAKTVGPSSLPIRRH
jgi:uncharacterized protein (TIGR02453 family)